MRRRGVKIIDGIEKTEIYGMLSNMRETARKGGKPDGRNYLQ